MGQVIPIDSVPGHLFTWHKGVGVTEESTLRANGHDGFGRNLAVRSHRTGKCMNFVFDKEILNEDEEVVAWVFKSAKGFEVHILND